MALVPIGYFGNITLTDAGGNKSTLRYDLTAGDIETADTDMVTILGRLLAITDAVVTGYSVGRSYAEDATYFAPEGVQVENVALISARVAAPGEKYVQLRIPAPDIGIFQQTTGKKSNVIDSTDVALQAYLSTFVDSGLALVSDKEEIRDPAVPGFVEGKRIHRGSRKG
jgi:hypothetical protein